MRNPLCVIGIHSWGDWFAHTNGPCVFNSEVHIFRACSRCRKSVHRFAKIQNGDKPYRWDETSGMWKPDLRAMAKQEREEFDV